MEYPETVTDGFNRNYQALSFVPRLDNEYDVSYWKHLVQYALWYMCMFNYSNQITSDDDIESVWLQAQSEIALLC